MSSPVERASAEPEPAGSEDHPHLPLAEGGGCLEILSDRLRDSPGITAIEANFRDSTLTVRYQPTLVSPEQLNAVADEVGAMFAQRVTYCERRQSLEACEECALRLGRVPATEASEYRVTAEQGRIGLARRDVPSDSAELVRPLAGTKPWGAKMTPAEQEHYAKGRAMAALTATCLAMLVTGMVLERLGLPPVWPHAAYVISALTGGWFALRSSFRSLAGLRFDVNLLMILAAIGAGVIG